MFIQIQSLLVISILLFAVSAWTAPSTLSFDQFLKEYQTKNPKILGAKQQLVQAEFTKESRTDNWKGRLNINPQLNYETRVVESVPVLKTPNRAQNIGASYTQMAPTGTSVELRGQEFIEKSNPLLSSLDSVYSAKLTQDIGRNSFGKTQRAQARRAEKDFYVAQMEYRQSEISSCEEAFNLYTDTYLQQEKWIVLKEQLKDAQKAQSIARQLFKDRLLHKVDLLASESDFLQTKLQMDQAEQLLKNNKRQMSAYFANLSDPSFALSTPRSFLSELPAKVDTKTFSEKISLEKLKSQEFEVDRARSDRWTDVQLGLEMGQRKGRLSNLTSLTPFTEEYLYASLTFSFDVINKTEDSALKSAIDIQNSLTVQNKITSETQQNLVQNLFDNNQLLSNQVEVSEQQVKMLNEKADIAFQQMKRGKMDFVNYLIHRNAFRTQQINTLNLKKDLWQNHFSIKREFSDENNGFCRGNS